MGSASCEHVAAFKSLYRLQPLHILHRKLICPHSEFFSREAISLLKCMLCRSRRVKNRLHACLHCVFIGCFEKKHLHRHQKATGHNLSIDLTFGNTHCASCRDYVYDDDFEKVRLACRNGHRNGNHQNLPVWEPDKIDLNFLGQHAQRLTVDGRTTLGLRGLVNQGNTCFMNVVIQALTHSPVLRDYFLMEKHPRCPPSEISSCIVCEFSQIFQEFFSNENSNPMTPYRLLLLVWRNSEYLAGYEQQDAHEFLIAVLDMIHERLQPRIEGGSIDLTGHAERSIIDQVFTGYMQSNVVCNQCGNISQTIDPLRDISLDIPQVPSASLMDCLSKFTKKEQLGNASKINCKKCGKRQESSKQLTISRLPVVACLHLKRFEQTATGSRSKVTTPVSFPKTLDMGPFMSSARNTSLSPEFCDSAHYKYELFAVVNHMGNLQSGHYTSFIRQTSSWFRCDDSLITKASIEQVLNSEAYLLFYHKKSIRF